MTEFIIDFDDHRYSVRIDHREIVIVRLDDGSPIPLGRLTLEAAHLLAHVCMD